MRESSPTVPPLVDAYARAVASRLELVLGEDLVGVYLHGSGAMGGWDPIRSDVDLLGVASRPLTADEKAAVARLLSDGSLQAPGAGLEFSLVTHASLSSVSSRPPFELHMATGAEAKVVDGPGHPGDSDLVMHYAVCRERGVALRGPAPRDVFPEVPRRMLLDALLPEVAWGLAHAPARYAVLNACRARAYAEGGNLLSKLEGGEWAIDRGLEPKLVRTALEAQRGGPEPDDADALARLWAGTRQAFAEALAREA